MMNIEKEKECSFLGAIGAAAPGPGKRNAGALVS